MFARPVGQTFPWEALTTVVIYGAVYMGIAALVIWANAG